MNKSNKFSPEVRERAVRMVQEHRGEYTSLWASMRRTPLYESCTGRNARSGCGYRSGSSRSSWYQMQVLPEVADCGTLEASAPWF